MDEDRTRKAARKAADNKIHAARELIVEAAQILESQNYEHAALSAREALTYLSDIVTD